MTTDHPAMDETETEKKTGESSPSRKPAYVLAAEAEELAEEEKRASAEKAAFVAASTPPKEEDDKPEDGADVHGTRPGLRTNGANPEMLDSPDDDFMLDLTGKGWIKCSDGKMVRDDGNSIFIPGRDFSVAQMEMVAQLSAEKGWSNLYVYKKNGKSLHPEATNMLHSVLSANQMPIQCCMDEKLAGKFRSHLPHAEDAMRHAQLSRHEESKKAAAPAAPAPAAT